MAHNTIKEAYRAGYEFGLAQALKPQMSKWIPKKIDYRHYHYICSNCGYRSKYSKGNFCSDCGHKMEE